MAALPQDDLGTGICRYASIRIAHSQEHEVVEGASGSRAAIIEYFTSAEFCGRFNSFDARGVPTADASGEPLSKSALKKVEKLYTSQVKKLLNPPPRPAKRCKRESLPEGFWEHPGAIAAVAMRHSPRIGIDFGGVITEISDAPQVDLAVPEEDTTLDVNALYGRAVVIGTDHSRHLEKKAVKGVFESVRALVTHFGAANVFVVSKAGDHMASASTQWLHSTRFFERTGLLDDGGHVYYVTERALKRHVVEKLGITHFCDDRWSILETLDGICGRRYLFPSAFNDAGVPQRLVREGAVVVGGWEAVLADLCMPPESGAMI